MRRNDYFLTIGFWHLLLCSTPEVIADGYIHCGRAWQWGHRDGRVWFLPCHEDFWFIYDTALLSLCMKTRHCHRDPAPLHMTSTLQVGKQRKGQGWRTRARAAKEHLLVCCLSALFPGAPRTVYFSVVLPVLPRITPPGMPGVLVSCPISEVSNACLWRPEETLGCHLQNTIHLLLR